MFRTPIPSWRVILGERAWSRRVGVLLCFGLAWFAPPLWAGQFREMVVFGDSTVDAGNVFAASGDTFPDPNTYYQGRFCNGPVWVERLASSLGVPVPTASELFGGTNYAWGGAATGLSGNSASGTPNVGTQISYYLARYSTLDAGQLVVVEGGYNDFGGETDGSFPVWNLVQEITELAEHGGKYFLVPNLLIVRSPGSDPQAFPQYKLFASQFNNLLPGELTKLEKTLGITIYHFDDDSVAQQVLNDPAAFGFTNVTDPAKSGDIGAPGTVVDNPDQYFWWDPGHATRAFYQILGARVLGAMFSFTVAAPASVTSGTAFDLTVKTLDPFGDIDANYQGTVTFSTSDTGKGIVLPTDYTFTEADAGVHTFPGAVTLMTPGEQTVKVVQTATGITGVVAITVGSGQ
jgi:phospholipase/lecithinase/hemolysin